eukprot:gene10833-14542_t
MESDTRANENNKQQLDDSRLLLNTNRLLSAVGIPSKRISSIAELRRVASSLFVAVFEALFHARIPEINRNPKVKRDYENNAQFMIDRLSRRILLDLSHITGQKLIEGDLIAIQNLVNIFLGVLSISRSVDGDSESDSSYNISVISGSITTEDSTFRTLSDFDGNQNSGIKPPSLAQGQMFAESKSKMEKTIENELKLAEAKKRREALKHLNNSQSRFNNFQRDLRSRKILHDRWVVDNERKEMSRNLKLRDQESILLRKFAKQVYKKMHLLKLEEEFEEKNKKTVLNEQLMSKVQVMESLFYDKIRVIKEKSSFPPRNNNTFVESNREEMASICKAIEEKQKISLNKETEKFDMKWDLELHSRLEAKKNYLALVSVDDWAEWLRHHHNTNFVPKQLKRKSRKNSFNKTKAGKSTLHR